MKSMVDVSNWSRYEIYKHYADLDNPFVYLTTKFNITKLYRYVKNNDLKFYPTFGYYITKVVNEIEEFKYRKDKDSISYYDVINVNFTENDNGKKLYYFTVPYNTDFNKFYDDYHKIKEEYRTMEHPMLNNKLNEIWISCAPWMKMDALVTPFSKDYSIPQVIWDKFEHINNDVYINLTIMVHHGFIDGYQIGKFINNLSNEIEELGKEE